MPPVAMMMYLGVAGALAPVLLKVGQGMAGWSAIKILVYCGVLFFYGSAFGGLVWVVARAPLTMVVPVWYATLLVTSLVCGWLIFGEKLTVYGWLAYGLIVAGLLLRLGEAAGVLRG